MLALEEGDEEEALMVEVVHPNIAAMFPQSLTVGADELTGLVPRQGLAVPTLNLPSQNGERNALDEWGCTLIVRPTSQA